MTKDGVVEWSNNTAYNVIEGESETKVWLSSKFNAQKIWRMMENSSGTLLVNGNTRIRPPASVFFCAIHVSSSFSLTVFFFVQSLSMILCNIFSKNMWYWIKMCLKGFLNKNIITKILFQKMLLSESSIKYFSIKYYK